MRNYNFTRNEFCDGAGDDYERGELQLSFGPSVANFRRIFMEIHHSEKKVLIIIFHFVFVFPSPKTVFIELRKILIKTCYHSKYLLCFNSNDFDYP